MIRLHEYHMSPFNQKVRRMLNHKGIAFETRLWALAERGEVRKFNPTGKLPALEHDGTLVCDSSDIVRYLEASFPQPPLLPAEPRQRALAHVLEDWADESLYFYEMHLRFTTPGNRERNIPRMVEHEKPFMRWLLGRVIPGGIEKITANQGIGRKSLEQLLVDVRRHTEALDALLLESDWLLGELSVADLAVFGMYDALCDCTEAALLLEEFPRVQAWLQRVRSDTSDAAPSAAQA